MPPTLHGRALKGIEVAGAAEAGPVKTKATSDYLLAALQASRMCAWLSDRNPLGHRLPSADMAV